MINDEQTNFLYLSEELGKKHPEFIKHFIEELSKNKIDFDFIKNTKDIWAVDYMPIQKSINDFITFNYSPDYLEGEQWKHLKTNINEVIEQFKFNNSYSNIILDGGNFIHFNDQAIFCDKIFKENKSISKNELISRLETELLINKITFVPQDKHDYIGHADGMVRFINNNTILINDYRKETKKFRSDFLNSFKDTGYNIETIPYNPYSNKSDEDANGIYINYLRIGATIFFPIFSINSDTAAFYKMEKLFPDCKIIPINSNEIAVHGGVLNCISWNIRK